ncbi:hypothetical protein SapgrDRAFT_0029 [Saprospira grandis DSM 2844]|uniref:Uncharacterized protein n=2 Tax=Saprospira TaxID=1007 RepID=J0P305_9BACT|nr:hypothetical protein SapgrDRAFT_0029 [Saprospira grandis DSM 2844]
MWGLELKVILGIKKLNFMKKKVIVFTLFVICLFGCAPRGSYIRFESFRNYGKFNEASLSSRRSVLFDGYYIFQEENGRWCHYMFGQNGEFFLRGGYNVKTADMMFDMAKNDIVFDLENKTWQQYKYGCFSVRDSFVDIEYAFYVGTIGKNWLYDLKGYFCPSKRQLIITSENDRSKQKITEMNRVCEFYEFPEEFKKELDSLYRATGGWTIPRDE